MMMNPVESRTSVHPRWAMRLIAVAMGVLGIVASTWQLSDDLALGLTRYVFTAVVATFLAVGVVLTERRPGNRVGPVLFVFGAYVGLYLILDAVVAKAADPGVAQGSAWLASLMDAPMFIMVSLLFLLFPDGRLPSPRWRALVAVEVALGTIVAAWAALKPGPLAYYPRFDNPFGGPGTPLEVVGPLAYLLLLAGVALSALTLVGRWRQGGPLERAQLKWVAFAAALVALAMVSYGIAIGPGRFNQAFDLFVGASLGFFPVAIGIAILRYRLFEIDRLVSRTIAYVLITALLIGAYAAVILLLQGPLGSITGGETISVALSTLVVAAMFQPIRRRVQRIVDHRFDRARFDAERTTAAFSVRLRGEVDIAAVTADLDATVRSSLKPRAIGLWLRQVAG